MVWLAEWHQMCTVHQWKPQKLDNKLLWFNWCFLDERNSGQESAGSHPSTAPCKADYWRLLTKFHWWSRLEFLKFMQWNLQSGKNLLRNFIKHTHSTYMSVNNEPKPSATPLPHTMLLLDGTFCSTLNGGGGLEFYTSNRFARSSPVFKCSQNFCPWLSHSSHLYKWSQNFVLRINSCFIEVPYAVLW